MSAFVRYALLNQSLHFFWSEFLFQKFITEQASPWELEEFLFVLFGESVLDEGVGNGLSVGLGAVNNKRFMHKYLRAG